MQLVLANVGTPLVWASCAHLLIGNAVIGFGEGWLIWRLFKAPRRDAAIRAMIIANYFSMTVGYFGGMALLRYFEDDIDRTITVHNALAWQFVLFALAFVLTLLLEWPFCAIAIGPRAGRASVALRASLVAQSASYAVLVVLYSVVTSSVVGPFSGVHIDEPSRFANSRAAFIYYLSPDDGDVWRIHPDGSEREHVAAIAEKSCFARLCVQKADEDDAWDLCLQPSSYSSAGRRVVRARFARNPGISASERDAGRDAAGMSLFHAGAADLRPLDQRTWAVHTGFWPIEGLTAEQSGTSHVVHVAMETPFIMNWPTRYATILPGDQVVYQLGAQIMLLDLNQRKLGLITLGRGPVVVLDPPPDSTSRPGRDPAAQP